MIHEITENIEFDGNIYLFYAFDIGDDIDLEKIEKLRLVTKIPLDLPRYLKYYHIPLQVELPHPHATSHCMSAKLYSFGALSLLYKIPFFDSLHNLREDILDITNNYKEQSIKDARTLYNKIESAIIRPNFFHTTASYVLTQINPQKNIDLETLKKNFGQTITSIVRFETEALSEEQKVELLESAIGYFRGNLVIIDQEASFIYEDDYADILNIFEFGNIQHLELQFFDQLLNEHLDKIYERKVSVLPFSAYLPFSSNIFSNPVEQLGKLRADIAVITERLGNTIKLSGEPYLREVHETLAEKLELGDWRESIERKLQVVLDVRSVYQHKTDATREDLLTVLIIILIFIELVIGILEYFK